MATSVEWPAGIYYLTRGGINKWEVRCKKCTHEVRFDTKDDPHIARWVKGGHVLLKPECPAPL